MAGLMLATTLLRLGSPESLLDTMHNHRQIDLTMPVNPWMASQHMPGTCIHKLDARTRERIYQLQPRRWDRHIWTQPGP